MSRYSIPALSKTHEITVGWDPPLSTFFANVEDLTITDETADPYIFQVGQCLEAITEVMALVVKLQPYAIVPVEVIVRLQEDKHQPHERSPLQARMVAFFEHIFPSQGA